MERHINLILLFSERPQPPMNCTFYKDLNMLVVNCHPGPGKGSAQHFLLDVRETILGNQPIQTRQMLLTPQRDQEAFEETHSIYRERNVLPNFQLRDLKPGLEYTLLIYAENDQGKSEPIVMKNVKLINLIDPMPNSDVIFMKDLKSVTQSENSDSSSISIIILIGK